MVTYVLIFYSFLTMTSRSPNIKFVIRAIFVKKGDKKGKKKHCSTKIFLQTSDWVGGLVGGCGQWGQ